MWVTSWPRILLVLWSGERQHGTPSLSSSSKEVMQIKNAAERGEGSGCLASLNKTWRGRGKRASESRIPAAIGRSRNTVSFQPVEVGHNLVAHSGAEIEVLKPQALYAGIGGLEAVNDNDRCQCGDKGRDRRFHVRSEFPDMAKGSRNGRLTAMFSCLTRMKSRMVSTAVAFGSSIVSLRHFYVKFCKETTLHGLKHTVAENYHWLERWLWFVLTGIAFYGAVYCGLSQLSRYNSEPLVVSMQRDFRSWWTLFPAVTACFLDRVQPDKARSVIESTWNVTEESDPERFQYYYSFIELVTDVSFRTNLQNFWKYQSDETVKNIDLLQLALNVHPTFPLKVTVSKKDKDVVWIPVMTEMGICMTFNSEYAVYQFLLQEVVLDHEPLLQCHYHSAQCYVRIETFNNAVRYFVHSPYDIPSAISNPTGEVLPGEEVVIDFKVIEIEAAPGVKKLRLDQRRCRYPDEWLSGAIKVNKLKV